MQELRLRQETQWGTPLKWLGITLDENQDERITDNTKISDAFLTAFDDVEGYKGCVLTAKGDTQGSDIELQLRRGGKESSSVMASLNGQVLNKLPPPPTQDAT